MSHEAMLWTRTQITGSASARSVLRVLADHCGQDHSCYLRTRSIGVETELGDSTVRAAITRLVDGGLIRVYERYHADGSRRSNRYQLLVDGPDTAEPDSEDWADVRQAPQQDPEGEVESPASPPLQNPDSYPYTEASSTEASPVKCAAKPAKIATRVPDDFQPTEEMRAWFVAERLSSVIDGRVEHERFMDYWRAAPGVKGRKQDWPATWRNWMRSAAERRGWSGPGAAGTALATRPSGPQGGGYAMSTTDKRVSDALALREKFRMEESA